MCVLLTAAASAASAQDRQFGAKVGASFSEVTFDPDQGGAYDPRRGADGGGFLVLPMSSRIALQLEAMFTSKGAQLYDPEIDLTSTILLQYFEIPVLLRVEGPSFGSSALHVFAGPSPGIRLSAKRQISASGNGQTFGEKTDMSREIERFNFGFVVGAGFDIGRHFVIDGRFMQGLNSVDADTIDGVTIKNRGFAIMAGGRF
jgi:hypothetical protein